MQSSPSPPHLSPHAFGIQYLIFDIERWNENAVNRYLADAELYPLRLCIGKRYIRAKFTNAYFDGVYRYDYGNGVIGLIGVKKTGSVQ
jgi:hypothetical protein